MVHRTTYSASAARKKGLRTEHGKGGTEEKRGKSTTKVSCPTLSSKDPANNDILLEWRCPGGPKNKHQRTNVLPSAVARDSRGRGSHQERKAEKLKKAVTGEKRSSYCVLNREGSLGAGRFKNEKTMASRTSRHGLLGKGSPNAEKGTTPSSK